MAEPDDLNVAFHALQQGDVSREQLLDALFAMSIDRTSRLPLRPLGAILVQKQFLQQSRLREILSANAFPGLIPEEASRGDSIKLGQLLAMAGVVTYGQVMEALLQQETGRDQGQPRMRLGEYLVSTGYTTPQAIQRALSYQRKGVYSCSKCGARFNVVNSQANRLYQCIRCQGALKAETDSVRVDESAIVEAVQEGAVPPPLTPMPIEPDAQAIASALSDRAAAQALRAFDGVPPAAIVQSQYWQLEFAQFGFHATLLDVLRRMGTITDELARKVRASLPPSPHERPAIPGYRILSRATSGSRTAIYSAQSQFTPGTVGLKILHPDLAGDAAQVKRLRHDGAVLKRMDHPCIVKAYEYGSAALDRTSTLHFLRMEDVSGTALDHLIAVRGKLPPSRAVALTTDIAQALRHLEREGFVHGDIRAEDVLVDARNRGRLLDASTAAPLVGGGKDARIAQDVYAVGTLLRAMLTGSLENLDRPAGDFGSVNVSVSLLAALRSMLHPDPTRRFQHWGDLVVVLQTAAESSRA